MILALNRPIVLRQTATTKDKMKSICIKLRVEVTIYRYKKKGIIHFVPENWSRLQRKEDI